MESWPPIQIPWLTIIFPQNIKLIGIADYTYLTIILIGLNCTEMVMGTIGHAGVGCMSKPSYLHVLF